MAVSGLIALLDDIAAIADDVAVLTVKAAKKTTGIVTDDMAVTAEQALGIRREREIPVVVEIAKGSLKNKALILAPGALLLNAVAPWAITPILMAGGAFLAFEGVEKILHKLTPHAVEDLEAVPADLDPAAFEKERIDGAIRTDLILSGEIVAITLGEITKAPFTTQAVTLYAISIVMTVGVYGLVALLIKMDDAGEAMVKRGGGAESVGKLILLAAPKILHAIGIIGTVAMLMVGGHILLEGIHPLEQAIHHALEKVPGGLVHFLASTAVDIAVGAVAGLLVVGIMKTGIPGKLWGMVKRKPAADAAK